MKLLLRFALALTPPRAPSRALVSTARDLARFRVLRPAQPAAMKTTEAVVTRALDAGLCV
jgi:hypothetical protein